MPGHNLTRDEAAARSALIRVDGYRIDLDLTRGGEVFGSTTEISFTAATPGEPTFVDLIAPRVHSIILNGNDIDPATAYHDGRITLTDLAADNTVRIVASAAYSNTGQGLHRSVDPVDGKVYHYTHFEVPDARRVFATFEQPDLKGTFTFTVTAPDHWIVLSNSPTPDPERIEDGVARWRFAPTARISTYITAIVAGEYHYAEVEFATKSGQSIPLGLACRASMTAYLDRDELFEITRQGFDFFIDNYDRAYPFEKYDQVFVPEYNLGAMENVGCVTVSETYLFRSKATAARYQARAETLLHEMAHMWFGDLVTMRWWDDLWLKESFATYMASVALVEATRWITAWTSFANGDKAWGLAQDQLPSTHPIVADIRDLQDVGLNFDGITYAKGASVLKQLVAWVGRDAFIAGVRRYFDRHEWGNTTLHDLLDALSETSGRDLTNWSAGWLEAAGANTLRPAFTLDADGRYEAFAVEQSAPSEHPTLRPHRIGIGCYDLTEAGVVRTHRIEVDIDGPRTDIPALAGRPQPDLLLLNDDDLTFAKIRFDDRTQKTILDHIGDIGDSLARALCWTAAWDMVRSGEFAASDFITMALRAIDSETDIGVVETLHEQMIRAVEIFVDPTKADAQAERIAGIAAERIRSTVAGSDEQLAWAHLLGRLARTPKDLDLVADMRDGRTAVPGLVIDTDLGWCLLGALARAGRADDTMIDAALSADSTTSGRQYAAGARAALPTAAAKADAWASVVERDDLPNGVQSQVIGGFYTRLGLGFQQPSQVDLLTAYVPRYFAAVGQVWAERPIEVARKLVGGLYPRHVVAESTISATDAYLADPAVPPALRRLLIEGRDDVVRSLRGRDADAKS